VKWRQQCTSVVLCDCDLRDIKTEVTSAMSSNMKQVKTLCLMKYWRLLIIC